MHVFELVERNVLLKRDCWTLPCGHKIVSGENFGHNPSNFQSFQVTWCVILDFPIIV